MGNLSNFNISWDDVETVDFSPLAAGEYAAKVVASEIKETKKKDKMLNLTFELVGDNVGRKIFEMYMLTHENPKVVQIALGKLKSLAEAMDLDFDELNDTKALHGKLIGIKLKIVVDKSGQYPDKNGINGFMEYDDSLLSGAEASSDSGVEVEEEEEESPIVEEEAENEALEKPSKDEIAEMKAKDLKVVVKQHDLKVKLVGLKVSEARVAVEDALYPEGAIDEVVEENEEDEIFVED